MKHHEANCDLGDKCKCEDLECYSCGTTYDLIHDGDGDVICCDCHFEKETEEINQP
jgi:hypothetical protein